MTRATQASPLVPNFEPHEVALSIAGTAGVLTAFFTLLIVAGQSTAHIQAINATPHAQVTAIYSSRPQNNAELSARYGSPIQAYTDLDALLKRPDIHVVSVCSYPSQHAQHVLAAARAGKHIILTPGQLRSRIPVEFREVLGIPLCKQQPGWPGPISRIGGIRLIFAKNVIAPL